MFLLGFVSCGGTVIYIDNISKLKCTCDNQSLYSIDILLKEVLKTSYVPNEYWDKEIKQSPTPLY
jgi:hypothetical protein